MATKAIHIRIDEKQKKNLESIFAKMGLDIPKAVRIFLRKVEITQSIPFRISVNETISDQSQKE